MQPDYDVVIIGSGFGGSVTALRLTEKGYRVLVLEAGRRYEDDDFAKTSWNLRKFLWAPALGCFGIQRIHLLRNVMILAGAGVGGGSLNYANTLYVPPEPFFNDAQWKDITDWRGELMPHYDQAQRMLGVVTNPTVTDADKIMQQVADDMGVGDTWVPTPVGVFFGNDGEKAPGKTVPDPYFGGAGPARTGCIECGSCMTGCRYGAKNTLLKNYLGLAEKAGAHVRAMSTVTDFRQRPDDLWEVRTVRTGSKLRRGKRTVTATHVVLAAGTYGTQRLLFKMRDTGRLPQLSDRLGVLTRTNSESIVGAGRLEVSPDMDLTHGVAITSSIHPTADTHVEPCRYGKGSNAMGLFHPFLNDADVKMIGVEAGGKGVNSGLHAASLNGGTPGVLHGNRTYLLQNEDGQIIDAHSISAGLDYPGIGPEHAWLHEQGRVEYVSATDDEALEAFQICCRQEGIIPALETAHALAEVAKRAPTLPREHLMVVNLSGRGDKDMMSVAHHLGDKFGVKNV